MRFSTMAALLLVGGLLLGCRTREDLKPDSPQSTKAADTNPASIAPNSDLGGVDTTNLPNEGSGDLTLTYDLVKADAAKYRGKRVTWAFAPLSSEGKRIMCGLDMNDAIGARHAGIYVVEFASETEVGDAFNAAAFQAGSTVTATVAGQVDQFLKVRDAKGVPKEDIPKVTVPLLVYPTYQAREAGENKGKGKG